MKWDPLPNPSAWALVRETKRVVSAADTTAASIFIIGFELSKTLEVAVLDAGQRIEGWKNGVMQRPDGANEGKLTMREVARVEEESARVMRAP